MPLRLVECDFYQGFFEFGKCRFDEWTSFAGTKFLLCPVGEALRPLLLRALACAPTKFLRNVDGCNDATGCGDGHTPGGVNKLPYIAGPKKIPIIGQGGITTPEDAIEFLIAGATTVGVGTALFYDPFACKKINAGISEYMTRHEINSISELVGTLEC